MKTTENSDNRILVGIDLHGNNAVCGVVDGSGKRLKEKRLPCDLEKIIDWLSPLRERIDTIAIESTYNWYWLVDGLAANGFKVVLANPAKIVQYEGIKHADDANDAYFLADLLRLKILPTGHIYDREIRPTRDLLRRRVLIVQQATALKLSLKSLYTRNTGKTLSLSRLEKLSCDDASELFESPADQLVSREEIRLLGELKTSIRELEKAAMQAVKDTKSFQSLQGIPGVGKILGLTIALETGPIERFKSAGNYASYCRCVRSQRVSNGKVKGANNGKNGNKYLAWAWVEAAQYAKRYYDPCRQFYDRKSSHVNSTLATKALACKLSKAGWYVMNEGSSFNWEKAFSTAPTKLTPNASTKAAKRKKKAVS